MGLFNRLRGRPSSKDVAKERLQLVLMHDRASISPAVVEQIKDEIIQIISKYVDIDPRSMDVHLRQLDNEGASALVANIPLVTSRTRRTR